MSTQQTHPSLFDYELIDCGNGQKLERFGSVVIIRPEPDAQAKPARPEAWNTAICQIDKIDKTYHVICKKPLPEVWQITCVLQELAADQKLVFNLGTEQSQQVGIFPEHMHQWNWIARQIQQAHGTIERTPSVLNLFGYTGAASIVAAAAGAEICHVDASTKALKIGKQNQIDSGLENANIRWLCDDALAFVQREIRRGNRYDGIILDPPAFGKGPNGETFSFAKHVPELVAGCKELLSRRSLFFIFNHYPATYDPQATKNLLSHTFPSLALHTKELDLTSSYGSKKISCATSFVLTKKNS